MSNVSKVLCCLLHATLTALFVAVAVPGAANAGPYEVALAAAEQGDFVTALRLWRSLAEQGDADAQYILVSCMAWRRRSSGLRRGDEMASQSR